MRIFIQYSVGEPAFAFCWQRRRQGPSNCRQPADAPGNRAVYGGPDRFRQ